MFVSSSSFYSSMICWSLSLESFISTIVWAYSNAIQNQSYPSISHCAFISSSFGYFAYYIHLDYNNRRLKLSPCLMPVFISKYFFSIQSDILWLITQNLFGTSFVCQAFHIYFLWTESNTASNRGKPKINHNLCINFYNYSETGNVIMGLSAWSKSSLLLLNKLFFHSLQSLFQD